MRTEYQVVQCTDIKFVEMQVSGLLKDNWKLLGGISIAMGNQKFCAAQALYRESE